ncbi:MAG: putative dsRNA-binding protein [Methanoregula sp.]|jgi:ribonuclease-3|nr:putative dsRNA-binding protein [Methanoregula sp.]
MSGESGGSLIELLYDTRPDVNRIIDTFISRFNAVYGDPAAVRWDISKEDWQRYEFLGDRVLNLIIAQSLFTRREGSLDEGEMTRVLASVVSNRALDALSRRYDRAVFTRLIPLSIGEQETYGERITGGAFEAFIGALYCEVGLDDVTFFVLAFLKGAIDEYNPRENAIGLLQEYFQKRGERLPVYEEISRTGPDHRPQFTVRVCIADGRTFTGNATTLPDARRDAAQKALDEIGKAG